MSEIETTVEPKPKRKISNQEIDEVKTYMILEFGYDCHVCLPYSDGAAIIAKMEKAEKINSNYSKNLTFKSEPTHINFYVLSQKEYREKKMLMLLGVDDE